MGTSLTGLGDLSRHNRLRYIIPLSALFLVLLFFYGRPHSVRAFGYNVDGGRNKGYGVQNFVNDDVLLANSSAVLPNIPPRIWQFYTPFVPEKIPTDLTTSWLLHSPNYAYSIVDEAGSRALINKLATMPGGAFRDALHIFERIDRLVLHADLMRFVILACKGGVYSDIDVEMVRPLADWVPDWWKKQVRVIIGIEADEDPPVPGTTYPVQFGTWTVAGAPGHPIFWNMVEQMLGNLRSWPPGKEFTDDDVLQMTGPASFTEAVFRHLSEATGTNFTNKNVTGMRQPRLFGDVLILPIDGFTTGVGHSGSSAENSNWTMVRHHFAGSWRNGGA